MIKNYILSLVVLISAAGTGVSQCIPDPVYADSTFGVWPDTTENLPCAFGDEATYSAVINIKTLTDTAVTVTIGLPVVVQAYIEAFRVNSITGLPAGFTFIPNAAEWANGGAAPDYTAVQGCLQIVASQASVQALLANNPAGVDFDLTVVVDAKINSTNQPLTALAGIDGKWLSEIAAQSPQLGIQPILVEGYSIRVRPASGNCAPLSVGDIVSVPFNINGNYPNPFTKSTEIRFTAPKNQEVTLQIFNMIGKEVKSEMIKATRGANAFVLNSSDDLKPGIYFYTLNDGKKTLTRKMIVSGN